MIAASPNISAGEVSVDSHLSQSSGNIAIVCCETDVEGMTGGQQSDGSAATVAVADRDSLTGDAIPGQDHANKSSFATCTY